MNIRATVHGRFYRSLVGRRCLSLAALSLFGFVIGGCATARDAFVRDLESVPARYTSLSALPYRSVRLGDSLELMADNLEVGQFAWGKSRFLALQLPETTQPFYLVVKSYLVSSLTHFRYGMAGGAEAQNPWVFFPHVVVLDKDMNVILRSRAEDFRLNSNVHFVTVLGFQGPTGRTWLQAAIRIDPQKSPQPRYVVISTSSEFVGKVGAVPSGYWPYGRLDVLMLPPVAGVPLLVPMPGYRGPMVTLHYGNIGEIQVHAVEPGDLLRTIYGKKMERPGSLDKASPGKIYQARGLQVRAPDTAGYLVADRSTGEDAHLVFVRDLPSGHGVVTLFAQRYRPGLLVSTLDARARLAVAELQALFAELTHTTQDVPLFGTTCRRIDFTGKGRAAFLAPVRGYDIHCVLPGDGGKTIAVRIGGNLTANPELPAPDRLPNEIEDFPKGIALNGAPQ
jgi:hypothetical protein